VGRIVKQKDLINTRLANQYGGWIYCTNCNKNIGYLCYVTYDKLKFHYECDCGSKGSLLINFDDSLSNEIKSEKNLITIKNRLCCPSDESPLITILDQKLKSYELEIVCKSCGKLYKKEGRRK